LPKLKQSRNPIARYCVIKTSDRFAAVHESPVAMRSLNRRGQVVWKASPQMLERLADAEAEVEAEYQNER
jgi:hypothetical protein